MFAAFADVPCSITKVSWGRLDQESQHAESDYEQIRVMEDSIHVRGRGRPFPRTLSDAALDGQ